MKKELLEKIFNLQKNLIIEGGISSGKTSNVLFPVALNAISKNESLLILDSKEEYVKRLSEELKNKNYNTIILNLRDMENSDGFNPLEYPYNLYKSGRVDDAVEFLERIGKTLFYEKDAIDPFWTNAASDLFIGIALSLFEDANYDEINFDSINEILGNAENREVLTDYFNSKGLRSKARIFASTTVLAPTDTRLSILSVAKQRMRLFSSREKLSKLLYKTTFNFEDVVSKPTAIFVITKDENKTFSGIATMFIEQLYGFLLRNKVNGKFHFILDNFNSIEICNDLVDILDSCIARNIRVYIATRSLEEQEKVYGSYLLKLCDLLFIKNDKVKLVVDDIEEVYDKDFENIDTYKGNFTYPHLQDREIKTFDFLRFVNELRIKKINLMGGNNKDENIPVDALIKRIDEKLEEIEKIGQVENNNKE